jgi:hypothetical protein
MGALKSNGRKRRRSSALATTNVGTLIFDMTSNCSVAGFSSGKKRGTPLTNNTAHSEIKFNANWDIALHRGFSNP